MSDVIAVFGVLILLIGAVVLIKPEAIFGHMRRHSGSMGIHVLAVVVRLALGLALIAYADHSRFPVTIAVLGWLTLAVAITLGVMGRTHFSTLMNWAMGIADKFGRLAGVLAMVLGGFLIYAVY